MVIGFNANNENIHIQDGYGYKLYTYSNNRPFATYKDRDGKYPNENPILFDVNGDATVYLLPSHPYTFVLVDRDDKVVSVTHDINGGLYNTSLLATISNIEATQETIKDLLDRAAKANIDIMNLDSLLDEKAALVHTHKAKDILNLNTGVSSDANCSCGYWELESNTEFTGNVQLFLESAGTPDSGYTAKTLTRVLDESLLTNYFDITGGNLVCKKACNVLVNFGLNNMFSLTGGHARLFKNGVEYVNGFHTSNDYSTGGLGGVMTGGYQNMFVHVPMTLAVSDVLTFKINTIQEYSLIYSACIVVLPSCQIPV